MASTAPAQFLAVLGPPTRTGLLPVLAPDETTHWLPATQVTDLALGEPGDRRSDRLQQLCDRLGVRPSARHEVADVLRGKLNRRPPRGWSLSPTRPRFSDRLKEAGTLALAGRTAAARVFQYGVHARRLVAGGARGARRPAGAGLAVGLGAHAAVHRRLHLGGRLVQRQAGGAAGWPQPRAPGRGHPAPRRRGGAHPRRRPVAGRGAGDRSAGGAGAGRRSRRHSWPRSS